MNQNNYNITQSIVLVCTECQMNAACLNNALHAMRSEREGEDEEDSEENNHEKEPTKLPMRTNDEVRFVVTKIEFQDKTATQNISKVDKDLEGAKCIEEKVKDLPFVVYGSIRDECLGLLSWWSD